jgi:hypothetical protein
MRLWLPLAMLLSCGGGSENDDTIEVVKPPSPACQLAPGSYIFHYALASGDRFDCPMPADDILLIRADDSVFFVEPLQSGSACQDETLVDGCLSTIRRTCQLQDCSAEVLDVFDRETWTGNRSFDVICSDGSGISCLWDTWLTQ